MPNRFIAGVAIQRILIDESVSDSQIGNIDDADPELKQNDQVRINTVWGNRKETKNCPKDEKEDKIDPREVLAPEAKVVRTVETRAKIKLIEEWLKLLAAAQQIHSQLESINNSA